MQFYHIHFFLFDDLVGELQMGPTRASFHTTFPKNCGRSESPRTAICLKTVVGGKQGHAPVKYFAATNPLFCVGKILLRLQDCLKDEVNLATLRFGDITGFKTVVSVCL